MMSKLEFDVKAKSFNKYSFSYDVAKRLSTDLWAGTLLDPITVNTRQLIEVKDICETVGQKIIVKKKYDDCYYVLKIA